MIIRRIEVYKIEVLGSTLCDAITSGTIFQLHKAAHEILPVSRNFQALRSLNRGIISQAIDPVSCRTQSTSK